MMNPLRLQSLLVLCLSGTLALGYSAQVPLTDSPYFNEEAAIQLATFDLTETRLIHIFGEDKPRLATEGEKIALREANIGFFDITEHPDFTSQKPTPRPFVAPVVQPLQETKNKWVDALNDDLDEAKSNLWADVSKLSSFWTRSYKSVWGLHSSTWVHDHVSQILDKHSSGVTTSIRKVFHEGFPQNSVIARLESSNSTVTSDEREILVIGAHQDSLNYKLPFFRAPGADDDGSGTVSIMQMLRSLIELDFIPPDNIAIEFHWYAAEEGGSPASVAIASDYRSKSKPVKAMLQFDGLAVVPVGSDPIIGIFDVNVNKNLTAYTASLADKYNSIPWGYTNCGARCGSDHSSWTAAGYPAAFLFETLFEVIGLGVPAKVNGLNHTYHTIHDHVHQPGFNLTHAMEFVKLGLAFVTELAVSDF